MRSDRKSPKMWWRAVKCSSPPKYVLLYLLHKHLLKFVTWTQLSMTLYFVFIHSCGARSTNQNASRERVACHWTIWTWNISICIWCTGHSVSHMSATQYCSRKIAKETVWLGVCFRGKKSIKKSGSVLLLLLLQCRWFLGYMAGNGSTCGKGSGTQHRRVKFQ